MKDESYGFKLIGHDLLRGQGGVGEGMSLQKAKDGRRILWLAHEGPPTNFTGVDVTDPAQTEGHRADRAAARPRALQLARDRRRHHGRRLPDLRAGRQAGRHRAVRHQQAGGAEIDRLLRLLGTAFARRPPGLVRRRRIHPLRQRRAPTSRRPARSTTSAISIIDVRNPSKPSEVGRWWYPRHRARATARRRRTRLPIDSGGFAPTTPTSIRSGPTAPMSAISTAAPSSSTSPTSRRRRWSPPGIRIRPIPASPTRCCRCSAATSSSSPTNASRTTALDWPKLTWVVDARKEDEPRADQHLARCRRSRISATAAGATARTISMRTSRASTALQLRQR